ncbi:MAG: DUF6458 family protein [Acidimicrobiales bacterium]
MGIVPSLIVVAVGAILSFAIHVTNSHGFNLNTIGVILMVIGGIGFLLSLVFWSTWSGFRRSSTVGGAAVTTRRESVVREREVI